MKRSNDETEMAWIDAWNELYELTYRFMPYSVFLPDGTKTEFDELQYWLQQSAYQGYCVGLRHYYQKAYYGPHKNTGQYQIHAMRWLFGEREPEWPDETVDGYVLQPRVVT